MAGMLLYIIARGSSNHFVRVGITVQGETPRELSLIHSANANRCKTHKNIKEGSSVDSHSSNVSISSSTQVHCS